MLLKCGARDFRESLGLQFFGSNTWTPILWPSDGKSQNIGKDPNAGKDWKQEEEMTEEEMFGWHHWLHGREFEQAPGVGDGQGSLACYSPWGYKELHMTEWLNWDELDCKEINPVNSKGNKSWIFTGGTDTAAKAPILWPILQSPNAKNWLNGKDPDAEKDWRQEEKGKTENEMVEWHH